MTDATSSAMPGSDWTGVITGLRQAHLGLQARPWREIASIVGQVGARFLDEGDPLRLEALQRLPESAGVSSPMAKEILDGMAADWVEDRLLTLVLNELRIPDSLDGFAPWPGVDDERSTGRKVWARGPRLSLHVGAGNVPGVSVTSLIRALLVKSTVLLKTAHNDTVLPHLFLRGLQEADPELASAVAVAYWPGGEEPAVVLEAAEAVIFYGGDQAARSLRDRLPLHIKWIAYRARLSFTFVASQELTPSGASASARAAAGAVVAFDQRGCVSPHQIFVEEGGQISPLQWSRLLANALADLEDELPRGDLDLEDASVLRREVDLAELKAAEGDGCEVFSDPELRWVVVHEPHGDAAPSCLNRFVRVRPVSGIAEAGLLLAPLGSHLQTVGVRAPLQRMTHIAEVLARVGVTRVTPLESTAWPAAWWHHDGGLPLLGLLDLIDLECPDPTRVP